MAEFSAKDVMALRNRTGLPMMDCKAALAEANGDVNAAEDLLRKKLKGKMEKRSDRAAGEGCIAIAIQGGKAAIVELRAETDFTAKNEKFQAGAQRIADLSLACPAGDVAPTPEMTAIIDDIRITTGENCSIARIHRMDARPGQKFGSYVHFDGKTGVLVHAEGDATDDLLKEVSMHVTAAFPVPKGVTADDIPADVVEKERKFRVEQAMESGKPREIAEKMVEGGMKKFFAEIALLEQPFIKDPAKAVKDVIGPRVKIIAFARWAVGESA